MPGCCCFGSYEVLGRTPTIFTEGDMIFFGFRMTVPSLLIAAASKSSITHVGVVLKHENTLCLLESGHSYKDGLSDILTGAQLTSGVRLVNLEERLRLATTKVYIRKGQNLSVCVKANDYSSNFCKQHAGKPYEASFGALINSALHYRDSNTDLTSIFCSELVAEFLKGLYLLPQAVSSSHYTPATLAKKSLEHYAVLQEVCLKAE